MRRKRSKRREMSTSGGEIRRVSERSRGDMRPRSVAINAEMQRLLEERAAANALQKK